MERENIIEKFGEFLREEYYNEIVTAVNEGKKSIYIDFSLLDIFDPELADYLLENPEEVLELAEEAVKQIDLPGEAKLKIRIFNLPESREIRIRNIRAEHIGKLIAVDGIVKRASEIRPEVSEVVFSCPECGRELTVIQTERIIQAPVECECGNRKNFKLLKNKQKLYDARWIAIEEPFEIVSGERPSEIMVFLKEDLTSPKMQNKTDPGNRIKIVGILKELPRRVKGTRSRQVEIYIEANSVESIEVEWEELEITPEDEKRILELARDPEIYDKLVRSIGPSLYGLEEVKEAIVLQLFGGEPHVQKDKSRVRGDIHIFLVGDPSTAKSVLMKVVSSLIPRGRYVSGKGVTAAGLTATVVRDEEFLGGWVLEAGALVMCNRSLCAIDEFEKVEKTDQIALHEAMEQQSYHPNVEILLADGRKIKIGEFVDNLFNLLKDKFIKGVNCEILPLHKINIPILTTDGQKLFVTKINQVSRHKSTKKFVKITYSNGRKIIVTPEHPVFVFEDSITTKPAIEVKPGDFVPGPRDLPLITLSKNLELPSLRGRKKVIFPTEISADFGKFLGYFISEGHSYTGSSKEIGISNTSGSIISETQRITNTLFGITPLDYSKRNRTQRIISSSIFNFMLKNFPEIMQKAKNKRIPSNILTTEKEVLREFLKAAFEGDGSIESNAVCYRTSSSKLAEDYQDALLRFGIFSRIAYDKHNNSYKVYITSDSLEKFTRAILKKKYKKIEKLIKSSKKKLRKHDVLPASIGLKIRNLMKKVGLTYTGYFNPHIRFNFGITREVFDKYVKQIRKKIEKSYKAIEEIEDFKELRKKLNYSQKYVANLLKVSRGKIDYIERGGYAKEIREKFLKLFKQSVKIKIKKVEESLNQLENLKSFRWLKVKKVEVLENKGSMKTEWVYDVTVEPTKCFISNGLILHNTISIAKANIVATLPARTSILAGGNPKLGRFDPYLPIKEQIDVPETILARFDLKFALRDIPNPELDSKIADHILKARHYEEEEIKPEIDAEFIKKYVAYARKNCHPKLTKEAGEAIKDFFVKLREKVSGEEAPVPITLRQYEALIRLAEASAKIQLRNEVIKEDAIRAINLMKASLRQFGFDPEIGKIDIDRVEGHMTATQRSKVRVLLDVIEELTKTIGKNIPKEDIIKMAKSKGLKEFDIEKMLNELKNNGTLFEPRPGILQKM